MGGLGDFFFLCVEDDVMLFKKIVEWWHNMLFFALIRYSFICVVFQFALSIDLSQTTELSSLKFCRSVKSSLLSVWDFFFLYADY